ncbi:hypothetical protein JG688_00016882 [Phytophthora aleatoria]|uniref:Uncharacterized protein n=1 Tax=Phytophthora aleatoria TaxID=2496075 RepID=A0A8J5IEV9_9STRA|nr:hypothetical protein JG688_00016882 [Phytophthora aleatoria]
MVDLAKEIRTLVDPNDEHWCIGTHGVLAAKGRKEGAIEHRSWFTGTGIFRAFDF